MIKLLGAFLVMTATVAVGISSVMRLRRRVEFLSAVVVSLEMMKNEICSCIAPMEDVLETLSAGAPAPVRALYIDACCGMRRIGEEPFSGIWRAAVEKSGKDMLTREERETLCEIGMSLGRYDVEWQASAIDRAIRRFEKFRADAEIVRDRDSKVHAFLGIASGVFAVIILI